MTAKAKLSSAQKKVLKALAEGDAPLANKQLAQATGLEGKEISALIKELKGQGLVESPARCKYGLSDSGRSALK
jgi:DNA-binding MarR family transcriptional regulator